MDTKSPAERRAFLKALTTTTAALALGACGAAGGPDDTPAQPGANPNPPAPIAPGPTPPGPNRVPVWRTVPTIGFPQGVPSSISIAAYVSDPDGDALTITMNSVALPAGVTYDAANKRFVYDGVGPLGSTSGVVMTADDGRS
jgi:hypothetical protein